MARPGSTRDGSTCGYRSLMSLSEGACLGGAVEFELACRSLLQARQDTEVFRAGLPQGKSIIQLSVNMPGPDKCNESSLTLMQVGLDALAMSSSLTEICIENRLERCSALGPQSFVLTNQFSILVKIICLKIENTHPLGKYLDFDVFSENGKRITRVMMGLGARKCFICSRPAKVCAFRGRHSDKKLLMQLTDDIKLFEMGLHKTDKDFLENAGEKFRRKKHLKCNNGFMQHPNKTDAQNG